MGKKLGNLIRAARTDAGFTQAQLANKIKGVAQSDIGRYERGEAEPTAAVVKEIAKACGVTQKSLLDAMPKSSSKSTAKSTTSSAKSSSSSKSRSSSKSTSSAKSTKSTKSSSSAKTMQLTAAEKRLIELYRAADADKRKRALQALGEDDGTFGPDDVIAGIGSLIEGILLKN